MNQITNVPKLPVVRTNGQSITDTLPTKSEAGQALPNLASSQEESYQPDLTADDIYYYDAPKVNPRVDAAVAVTAATAVGSVALVVMTGIGGPLWGIGALVGLGVGLAINGKELFSGSKPDEIQAPKSPSLEGNNVTPGQNGTLLQQ